MAYDNSLIRIRFIGENLERRSVPIYELGVSLVAIQRLIHKAHLSRTQRLVRTNFPSKEERMNLALQLGERRRASDGYALVPVDGDEAGYLSELTEYSLRNILAYGSRRDFELFREIEDERKLYIINTYNQIENLAQRIGNVGGIEAIEISGETENPVPAVYITEQTTELLRDVKGQQFRGVLTEIHGSVTDLYPANNTIKLFLNEELRSIAIRLTPDQFDTIRYSRIRNPEIHVVGWPLHKMGVESLKYDTFEARAVDMM